MAHFGDVMVEKWPKMARSRKSKPIGLFSEWPIFTIFSISIHVTFVYHSRFCDLLVLYHNVHNVIQKYHMTHLHIKIHTYESYLGVNYFQSSS